MLIVVSSQERYFTKWFDVHFEDKDKDKDKDKEEKIPMEERATDEAEEQQGNQ